jgi:hypothetical protein
MTDEAVEALAMLTKAYKKSYLADEVWFAERHARSMYDWIDALGWELRKKEGD